MRKKRKSELIAMYNDAVLEAEEMRDIQQIKCLRSKLEEKIGGDKDVYLEYKIVCRNGFEHRLSIMSFVWSGIAIAVAIISSVLSNIGFFVSIAGVEGSHAIANFTSIFLWIYAIALMCLTGRCTRDAPTYGNIAVVLEEIYKEKFEGQHNETSEKIETE